MGRVRERDPGRERAELLDIVANRRFDARRDDTAARMTDLLNSALDLAAAGDLERAAEVNTAASEVFESRPTRDEGGFNHDYPLQAGAAIGLLRAGLLWERLGDVQQALSCFASTYERFSSAYEEQFGEEDWWSRQLAAEGRLRQGDLLERLGRHEEAQAAWSVLLPNRGFMWPALADWAEEARRRLS
jgi:tetratricopeptide (TPR) repeat protein